MHFGAILKRFAIAAAILGAGFGLRFVGAQEEKALRTRFHELDSNGDSKLSTAELTDPSMFESLDTNKDTFVTLQEAKQAFATGVLTREQIEGRPRITPQPDPVSSAGAVPSAATRQNARILRPAEHGIGRHVNDLSFNDIAGNKLSLNKYADKRLTVVAMTSTSCPLSRKYLPTLAELVQAWSDKGVHFIAVNCVPTDTRKDMQAAAAVLGPMATYVHDADETLAGHLSALTTTDVFVLDQARTVVYHGAIDDQYGIGYALDQPRNQFLAKALASLLAGTSPQIAATVAPGCTLEHEAPSIEIAHTYHNRISRIMQQNCIECHRSGGVGPFALDTFADVVGHAAMIRQVVDQKTMPPWFAAKPDGQHTSVWANDRSLTDADCTDLLKWLSSDRIEGDPEDAPLPRVFAEEWTLGVPDLVVQLPKPIAIKATGTMPYQFVTAETTLSEDKWVQGYEIIPSDPSVVHHVIVNVHEKGSGRARDREEGIGGYWAAYVPGNAGQVYPEGFARKLSAGSTVSFQIHYTPNGTVTQDQLKMGLKFATSEPKYVVTTIPLADADLNIPPHVANHVESITRPVIEDTHVLAYMAHMHVRGKAFHFELITADGKTETLLDIPRYDFNWQLRYDYREPKVIPAGSKVKVTAVFDNSENNPANPDPTKSVRWGQQTYDEMMIGYVETFVPVGEQSKPARARIGNAAIALFTLLDANGDSMLSRDEARRAISRVPRLKDNPEILEILFSKVDTDKDDQLSIEEYDQLRQEIGNRR